ncbi:Nicotinamidase-related amidase [Clostridium cavendishii DSM 21758]|uniref:Nicotinamidase-related amidase n=1 Tax=Clostridium cavendishii DSM 21758 TaxID=1121302 RepID=A0A1M6GNV5_9CLOT|nr:isochorismatase family cysteine hydrolase [Clostridium cavendishii]SHJ11550.1 Nicotinamidase-related amidase [Clostridium cavendishii DSM 21758]
MSVENRKFDNPQKALLVIDIQEDYTGLEAKPPFPYKDSERLIKIVNNMIDEASKKDIVVVYISQEFDGFVGKTISKLFGHGTAIKGNSGAEFDKRINIISNHCFTKNMPDAFTNHKLEMFLDEHQINELYLVGLDAAACVYFTAKGALKRGYNVSIIKDGIVLLEEKKWDSVLKKFEDNGITLINSQEF